MSLNTKISSGIAICAVANVNVAIPLENTKYRKIYAVSTESGSIYRAAWRLSRKWKRDDKMGNRRYKKAHLAMAIYRVAYMT